MRGFLTPNAQTSDTRRVSVRDPEFSSWLVEALRCGFIAVDARGAIAGLNAEAQRILGGPPGDPAEWLGVDSRQALAATPEVARLLLGSPKSEDSRTRAELVLDGVEGQPARTIGYTLAVVPDARGKVQGASLMFRDLTPFERMDEQARQRDRLAALGQMAAGLAHELRNPLASLEVIVGLLKRRLTDPENLSLVEDVLGELRDLEAIANAGLNFLRPQEVNTDRVDLEMLLEDCLAQAVFKVGFAGEVKRVYDESLPRVWTDPEKLRVVAANLIGNALEEMVNGPSGTGRLTLHLGVDRSTDPVERDLAELSLRVADTGPGVPPNLREKIFYPFFTTKKNGSGIGLATVHKIVANLGGTISLGDEPGGAEFHVRVPVELRSA